MDKEICLRKRRSVGQKIITPQAAICFPKGEFRLYTKAIELMSIDRSKHALMFYFKKSVKIVRVEIEEKAEDNYWLSDAKGYYRFTSKDLGVLFSDILDLPFKGKYYFNVFRNRGHYFLELIDNHEGA